MDRALIFIVVLVILIPLLTLELPILIASTPKWILKILCFLPFGGILFLAIHAFLQGNMIAFFLSIPIALLGLYGGFTLKNMVEDH